MTFAVLRKEVMDGSHRASGSISLVDLFVEIQNERCEVNGGFLGSWKSKSEMVKANI